MPFFKIDDKDDFFPTVRDSADENLLVNALRNSMC